MWTYAIALASGIKNRASHSESIWTKIIDSLEVKIVYTDFDDPKEALVRAVSQKQYGGNNRLDKTGMDGWTREDLKDVSLEELIGYYRFSSTGMFISIPVKVPENN